MTDKPNLEADLDRVLAVVDEISGDRPKSLLWLRSPLEEFKGHTPERLVSIGRVDDVIAYLNSTLSPFPPLRCFHQQAFRRTPFQFLFPSYWD